MQRPPKAVAITGAAGYIGSRLLRQLESNANIGKVVAFDKRPLPYPVHNISYYQFDVSKPITEYLVRHRVETLVHLASAYTHTSTYQDWAAETALDQMTLDAIQASCVAARVKQAIFLSSHTVYGAFPDNPVPLTEAAPLRDRPGDFLGEASVVAELSILDFLSRNLQDAEAQPTKVTVLRTCPVLGYSDDHQRVERVFPNRFWGAGDNPPYQFLHEVDLAELLEEVIEQEAEGVFNVAGEGVVFLRELAEITSRKLTQLPPFLAYPADWLASKRKQQTTGNWNLHLTRYPIIMSTGKIKQTLKFRFEYTSMEALNAFVNYNGL